MIIYIVQNKETFIVVAAFNDREKAERYIDYRFDLYAVKSLEVIM